MKIQIDRAKLAALTGAERKEAEEALAVLDEVQRTNPLAFFEPHPKQAPFITASTPVVAAFTSNRWGKTTGLVARFLRDCLPEDWLPASLRGSKQWGGDNAPRGTFCRIVNPSFALLESVILPAFRQWTPAGALHGGSFDKAYKGPPDRKLQFACGSWIQFMTHEQDLDKFGGSALHVVGYDEPPPQDIREECKYRLIDFDGYEVFACTPLKVNVSWMRRDIYRQREHPEITVVGGSIHDNPHLSEEGKRKALEAGDPRLRPAREHGQFVDVGGLIYPDFERSVVPPVDAKAVSGLDVVVGIDPGRRNAAFIWVGFDSQDVGWVFDEMLLQDSDPADYALGIIRTNARWGLGSMEDRDALVAALRDYDVEGLRTVDLDELEAKLKALPPVRGDNDPLYVIDPSARSRGQVTSETVQSALSALGIPTVDGQNDVEAGISQVSQRLSWGRLKVCENCRGLRDEADDYAAEPRDDGVLKPIKVNDHRCDALRYAMQQHPYYPEIEADAPEQRLGWQPGRALDARLLNRPGQASSPLGAMS